MNIEVTTYADVGQRKVDSREPPRRSAVVGGRHDLSEEMNCWHGRRILHRIRVLPFVFVWMRKRRSRFVVSHPSQSTRRMCHPEHLWRGEKDGWGSWYPTLPAKKRGKILSCASSIFGEEGLDFQGMAGLSLRCLSRPGEDIAARPLVHRQDEPTKLSLGSPRRPSQQSPLPFHLVRRL